MKVVVLRWGHRPRDYRLTTHVALAARALGANGIILSDVKDEAIKKNVEKVVETWGGSFFFEDEVTWREAVEKWKSIGGIVVHLTVYGENLNVAIERIRACNKDIMVLVGSRKVPGEFYSKKIADFNVAVGSQPHSECSSLAVFLDRLFEGRELNLSFENATLKVIPTPHGKRVVKLGKERSNSRDFQHGSI